MLARQGFCRKGAKGFNWVSAQLLFVCADSRFAEPRSFLKKVLIVAVRSCGCGALIRGWQNLGTFQKDLIRFVRICYFVRCFEVCKTSMLPAKGTFFVLFACTKRTGSTPEVCEPLDSGDDSKLCRKRFSIVFRRHVPKPVLCKAATSLGIAGNDLNRCDVQALQRKDLERTAKEQLHSLQTVG